MIYPIFVRIFALKTEKINSKFSIQSLTSLRDEYNTNLDVPTEWTKLLPFLNDGMKETNSKHQLPPCYAENYELKEIVFKDKATHHSGEKDTRKSC